MPILDEVKLKYSKENINFISISVDNDSIKLVNFNKKEKVLKQSLKCYVLVSFILF